MTSQLSVDLPEIRDALGRVLASRAFRDREILQHLLEYLVERTLDGTADSLKEYVIGVDVFHKPNSYDPQSDASVRVQIGRLRRKLEEYYLEEGAADTLLLQLPKRHFTVSFERKALVSPSPPEISTQAPPRRIAPLTLLPWALAVFFAAGALFFATRPAASAPPLSPELAEIWKQFLAGSRPILMSLGNLQFYQYSSGMIREPAMDRMTPAGRQARLAELQTILRSGSSLKSDLIYTGVGQATAAFLLANQFGRMHAPVDLVRSSALGWDEIAQHNVIFLGSAKLNSQLREIAVGWPFRVEAGQILNLQPKSGEAASYGPDYSLITLVSGLHGRGEIMVLESASTTGVWAAAQFLTDPEYAKELVAHLRAPDGRLPRRYQVVLKSQIAADVPIRISYVTHRTL